MKTTHETDATDRGHLSVHVAGHGDVEPTLYLVRQGARNPTQPHPFRKDHQIEISLPPGTYLGQVTAAGHLPATFAATVTADKTTKETVALKKGSHPVADFATRLRAYGFAPSDAIAKIELKPREHRVAKPGREGTNLTQVKSLTQLRQFIGAPAAHFSHDVPRFEPVAAPQGLQERLLERKLTEQDRAAISAMLNEHLNGNERAYSSIIGKMEESISQLVNAGIIYTLSNDLYIAPGATYTFTGTLVVDTLKISKTGNLNPTGNFKVDVTNWVVF